MRQGWSAVAVVAVLLWGWCLAAAAGGGEERDGEPVYYVAVGAVFRDEDSFLQEWIEFHLCAGVEHFFLYNHESSTRDHEAILAPYVASGHVTLEQAVCDVHCQVPTYQALLRDHGSKSVWLALIDIDEFLYPAQPSTVSLAAVLRPFEQRAAAVCVHWIIYGSSNHTETPDGLVIDNFFHRSPTIHTVIKTIAQPRRIARAWAHNHEYFSGWEAVNERFEGVDFDASSGEPRSALPNPSASLLRINHYRVKSMRHARWRYVRDSTFRLNDFDNPDVFPETEQQHEEWIQRWDAHGVTDESAAVKYGECVRKGIEQRTVWMHERRRDEL